MPAVVTDNYHWVITAEPTVFQSFQAVSKWVGALEKEDWIDEIKYSPPIPYSGNKLGGGLREVVSPQEQTSPYFQLREKSKCIV